MNSEKRHILRHLHCFQQPKVLMHTRTTSYLALQLFFGSWFQDYSWYVSISLPPGSLEMKEQFLPKQSLGKVRSGGTFQSAIWKTATQVQLLWPHAVLTHDASQAVHPHRPARSCARPHLRSTRQVVTLQVHNIKPPLLPKTAEALHRLAHFRLEKKKKTAHK